MADLWDLEEIVSMLKAQEKMQDILEKQENEITELREENRILSENLDESMSLNTQLTRQINVLNGQIEKLQEQISTLRS